MPWRSRFSRRRSPGPLRISTPLRIGAHRARRNGRTALAGLPIAKRSLPRCCATSSAADSPTAAALAADAHRLACRAKSAWTAEVERLRALPRYRSATTEMLGYRVEIPDTASFLEMYDEILVREIFAFDPIAPRRASSMAARTSG